LSVQRSAFGVQRSPEAPKNRQSPLASLDYSVLQQCMHCGLCLPSCPTYAETGKERNSPRGRIALMRAVADGELETTRAFADEMSYCLGCLACTSACPANVNYGTLLETARAHVEESGITSTPTRNLLRAATLRGLFTRPRLLRLAGRLLGLYQASGVQAMIRASRLTGLLPRRLRELEALTPKIQRQFSDALIAEVEKPSAVVNPTRRVAVLTGCVQDLVFSDVNRATVDVLLANNCEVTTPRAQGCCGSLHAHNGDLETARELARRQLDAIDPHAFDAVISNAAGCGSHLKHYDRLLADDPTYADRAAEWSRKVKDVTEWLVEIGFRPPQPERRTLNVERRTPNDSPNSDFSVQSSAFGVQRLPAQRSLTVTYHEACHLCHGQKISAQPREILRALPGAEIRECAEGTWCCGSAGIYNLTQPATAAWLQARKVQHLQATGAGVVVTANPGCHLQIENGLRAAGDRHTRVMHPVVLLAEAYRAETR
jgi:glycolate oxidase iron-sulfur subunit